MRRAGIFVASLFWFASGTASAQRVAHHRGFWISPTLGYTATFSDPLYEVDGGDQESGVGLGLRLGGTPSQQLLLGAELVGWNAGGSVFRGHSAFTALFYLSADGGPFLDATVGLDADRVLPGHHAGRGT
jgi:hypothetical protein